MSGFRPARLGRVDTDAGPRWVDVGDDELIVLTGDFASGFAPTADRLPRDGQRWLAPVAPGKIIGLAQNYAAHAAEMGKEVPDVPRIFIKPGTSLVGPDAPVVIPPRTERVDPEGELGVVIGRRLHRASAEDVLDAVFGYTCVNDVTARDFQKADGQFTRAKGFDSFCPVGPWVVTDLDARDVALGTWVNGEPRAAGRTSEMIFDLVRTLVFLSDVMTLEPGDLIATGTPPGVAPIHAGDVVEVRVEGIGVLRNPVVDRDDR